MRSEKNLHAAVPPALLARAQETAQQERISFDELISDAVEQLLNSRGLEEVLAFGKRHARERGLKPSDVTIAIAEERRKNPERGS